MKYDFDVPEKDLWVGGKLGVSGVAGNVTHFPGPKLKDPHTQAEVEHNIKTHDPLMKWSERHGMGLTPKGIMQQRAFGMSDDEVKWQLSVDEQKSAPKR